MSHSLEHDPQPAHDDDDIPLSTQLPSFSRLKKRRVLRSPPVIHPPSDSDDDVPLASKLKKPQKPTSRSLPPQRKSDTKPRTKKVIKRPPRAKKEEDAPTRKFENLGQRRETPPENDPTRLFYQSMYREKISLGKRSQTAEVWMLRNGLLEQEEAEAAMEHFKLKK